ncbi:MAG TPA: hypothetical protein VF857_06940, partial [Spirochaetota bacterium]
QNTDCRSGTSTHCAASFIDTNNDTQVGQIKTTASISMPEDFVRLVISNNMRTSSYCLLLNLVRISVVNK